eukprot:4044304-Alexandrium_andersonii.AAC.1
MATTRTCVLSAFAGVPGGKSLGGSLAACQLPARSWTRRLPGAVEHRALVVDGVRHRSADAGLARL